MAYQAINEGAAGVDMGRNIFQCDAPQGDDPGSARGGPRRRDAGKGLDLYLIPQIGTEERVNMPNKNTTQVVCVAEFRAKEGKTDELIAALHVLMKPTHAEPGCIRYELNQRVMTIRAGSLSSKNGKTGRPSMSIAPCHTSCIFSTTCGRGWWKNSRSSCTRRSALAMLSYQEIERRRCWWISMPWRATSTAWRRFLLTSRCKLRPHFKNHKAPLLAWKQIEPGAIGMTCATLREAEILVQHGIAAS